jgi:RNA polymerase sigma-70 factor (ECF subfamily)
MPPRPVEPTAVGTVTPLLEQARQGSAAALGTLLQAVRNHLLLQAEKELPWALRAKMGPSDIVQETAIDAHRDFCRFRGTTPEELYAWLRVILQNNVRDAVRRFEVSQKRATSREQSIDVVVDRHGVSVVRSTASYPEQSAMRREDASRVLQLLDRVPADYRTVLRLRYWDGLTFPQISERIGRTDEAVRKLWYRALSRLNAELQAAPSGPQDRPLQD